MPWRGGVVAIVSANRTEDRGVQISFFWTVSIAMLFFVTEIALYLGEINEKIILKNNLVHRNVSFSCKISSSAPTSTPDWT
jgi:hypothetical protein